MSEMHIARHKRKAIITGLMLVVGSTVFLGQQTHALSLKDVPGQLDNNVQGIAEPLRDRHDHTDQSQKTQTTVSSIIPAQSQPSTQQVASMASPIMAVTPSLLVPSVPPTQASPSHQFVSNNKGGGQSLTLMSMQQRGIIMGSLSQQDDTVSQVIATAANQTTKNNTKVVYTSHKMDDITAKDLYMGAIAMGLAGVMLYIATHSIPPLSLHRRLVPTTN